MNIFKRLWNATKKNKLENELNAEMRFHLEKEIEENMARGMSAEEARRQALISFGGVQQTRESLREVQHGRFWDSLVQDVRYGARMLRNTPVFTMVAVLTLALGIGANSAIFSLIDAVLFRPLPVSDPKNLVFLEWHSLQRPQTHSYRSFGDCEDDTDGPRPNGCSLPLPFFRDLQSKSGVFSHVTAYTGHERLDLSGNGPARIVYGQFVSGDYFGTLGVRPHRGRVFLDNDDTPEAPPVAVLSYAFWQSTFGGSESVIGKTVRLNGQPFAIIGVTEPKFEGLTMGGRNDVWVPLTHHRAVVPQWTAKQDAMDSYWLIVIGRVKPEVPVTQAQAGASLLYRNDMLEGAKPIFKSEGQPEIKLVAAQHLGAARNQILQPLYILLLFVGVVLMIACANVAGLLLARSAVRQREMAVRLALGAKRGRLIRQLLTESVMLSAIGGALGLVFGVWGVRVLLAMVGAGDENPPQISPHIDWTVLAFTAGISVLTGIIFGLAPASRASAVSLTSSLKAGGGAASAGAAGRQRRFTAGSTLVSVQMALAILVLVVAGLLVRTLGNLKNIDPGFDTRSLLLFAVDPRMAGYKGAQVDNLYHQLQEKFAALPGVTSASYSQVPLLIGSLSTTSFRKPGTPRDSKEEVECDELPVGPNFFTTLRIPFQIGRDFTVADFSVTATNDSEIPGSVPTPVIVNQFFVQKFLPSTNPLGQTFADNPIPKGDGKKDPGYQIVGVVANAKYSGMKREVHPTLYSPNASGSAFFELRTVTDPNALIPTVRNLVTHENQDLALFRISTQIQAIDNQMTGERLTAQLASVFGLLALGLACMGLYGLLAYEVTRRTREIGIRMAIGAQAGNVIRLVLGRTMVLVCVGAVIGIAGSLGVARLLKSALYGVKAGDPLTLLAVLLLLGLVAMLACLVPARRATKVDPMVALRYE